MKTHQFYFLIGTIMMCNSPKTSENIVFFGLVFLVASIYQKNKGN